MQKSRAIMVVILAALVAAPIALYAATSLSATTGTITVGTGSHPTISASPNTIEQGQTSSLTSTAVTTGTSPYTYQWLQMAPGSGSFTAISGAVSSSYSFSTSASTTEGGWLFELLVTDNAGAAVTSDVATVTVELASVSILALSTTSSIQTGGTIAVAATVRNTMPVGSETFTIADSAGETLTCGSASLSFATSTTCSGSYIAAAFPGTATDSVTVFATDTAGGTASSTASSSTIVYSGSTSITLSQTSGAAGTTITVTGSGFLFSKPVSIQYDGILQVTTTSSASGTVSASLKIPSATASGTNSILATDGTNTASATFTATGVTASITLSPTTGATGSTLFVTGSGFAGSTTITVKYDGTAQAISSSSASGAFSATFNLPLTSANGANTVVATDGTNSASATFTATGVTPAITLSPSSAIIGTSVTVKGSGFAASSTVTVSFDGTSQASATSSSSGAFSVSFTVPSSATGSHTVSATDTSSNSATAAFRVTPASISLSPSSEVTGTSLSVSGTGFKTSSVITITYDGSSPTTTTSSSTGTFSMSFTVPTTSANGANTVLATDGTNSASATFTATGITPSISLIPSSGIVGTSVTILGSGFAGASIISLSYDGIPQTSATVTTTVTGGFSTSLTVPASAVGTPHTITATDASSNTASMTFTVTPSITLSSTSGNAGSTVTLTGTGFAAYSSITVDFDGTPQTTSPTTVSTSLKGSFGASLTIPLSASSGAHTIFVSDGTNSKSITFTVVGITLSPTSGQVGSSVTLRGGGLAASTSYRYCFASAPSVCGSSSATFTTDGSGNIPSSTALTAPSSSNSFVVVSSSSIIYASASFTVTYASASASSTTTLTCTQSSLISGAKTQCTGTIVASSSSATGTVAFTSGSGSFSPTSVCSIAPTTIADTFSCYTYFVAPSSTGSVTISATYSGDSSNLGSSGTVSISVTSVSQVLVSISCPSASVLVGSSLSCSASVSPASATGEVDFSTSSNAFLSVSECSLSFGTCSVNVVGAAVGSATVNATFVGVIGSTTIAVNALAGNAQSSATSSGTISTDSGGSTTLSNVGGTNSIEFQNTSAPAGSTVSAVPQVLSSAPSGSGLSTNAVYVDLLVGGVDSGNVTVCVPDSTANSSSTIEYLNSAGQWVTASNIVVTDNVQVCGTIAVTDLSGTNIAIGNPSSPFSVSCIPTTKPGPPQSGPQQSFQYTCTATDISLVSNPPGPPSSPPALPITVSFTSSTGSFLSATCNLGPSGSCSVHYSSETAGSVTVTATFKQLSAPPSAPGHHPRTPPGPPREVVLGTATTTFVIPPATTTTTVGCHTAPSTPPPQSGNPTSWTCTATVSGVDPTGTVSFSANGAPSPFATCTLPTGPGHAAYTCSVTFTDASTSGSVTITAVYSGDSNNEASTGITIISPGPPNPPSPPRR